MGQDSQILINIHLNIRRRDGVKSLTNLECFMLASRYGHTEIVKYLIEAKASLDLQKQV